MHQGRCLWLLAGTGEGPVLASELLRRGWRLRVSLVSAAATQAYGALEAERATGRLELHVGVLGGAAAIVRQLEQARRQGDPFSAVIDATHPFAQRISAELAEACAAAGSPLLRYARAQQTCGQSTLLSGLDALRQLDLRGQPVLFALGARQLAAARKACPGALHHARVLPSAQALQQALAAGLAPERIAPLRPSVDFAIEAALVRSWGIAVILCRQSGGVIEAGWRQVAEACGCRLLLLARPAEAPGVAPLSAAALLAKLDQLSAAAADGP
ncbi:MAG: precorrin-6A/cobalt-precorrin-6A reductase [Cyanobacteria bacterium K_DeepCast_35m_m2_023]|nr:precorrin-6A/cobalt-precorrin-6A reductase [Cyanobacteria bacterium K_DeepCast_35m_m2_023]